MVNTDREYGREYQKQYRLKYPERVKETAARTKEKILSGEYDYSQNNKTYHSKNKEEQNRKARERYYKDRETYKQRAWKNHLLRSYGLTEEDYKNLWEGQKGLCSICKNTLSDIKKNVHVDHDHITGKVRGLLCKSCNQGLGFFQDSPKLLLVAAEYLDEHKEKE